MIDNWDCFKDCSVLAPRVKSCLKKWWLTGCCKANVGYLITGKFSQRPRWKSKRIQKRPIEDSSPGKDRYLLGPWTNADCRVDYWQNGVTESMASNIKRLPTKSELDLRIVSEAVACFVVIIFGGQMWTTFDFVHLYLLYFCICCFGHFRHLLLVTKRCVQFQSGKKAFSDTRRLFICEYQNETVIESCFWLMA